MLITASADDWECATANAVKVRSSDHQSAGLAGDVMEKLRLIVQFKLGSTTLLHSI